jgi:hypothetical protein
MAEETRVPKLQEIVNEDGKVVSVDWGKLSGLRFDSSLCRCYDDLNDKVIQRLTEKEFLLRQSKGAFIVLSDQGMDLSPSTSYGSHYGFREQKDAEAFAKSYYGTTFYGIRIAQLVTDNLNRK